MLTYACMSTKSDFLAYWCARTGEPVAEARLRIRALAIDGLMPWRQQPLDYPDIARALLGFVAATQHKDAAETVRRFSEFRCGVATANALPLLMSFSLLDALTTALRPPLWIRYIEVSVTGETCALVVCHGWITVEEGEAEGMTLPGPDAQYWFKNPAALPLLAPVEPVEIKRSISGSLIGRLLTDLMHHPVPPIKDGWTLSGHERRRPLTKGAGVEPRNPCTRGRSVHHSPSLTM